MNIETIVVNSDKKLKLQDFFVINSLHNYSVAKFYDFLHEVQYLNNNSLLIVSLNTKAYDTDFLSIDEIINKYPDLVVVVLTSYASKEILSRAFSSKCAAIVDKQHFQLYTQLILDNAYSFKGFYVSPLFTKYLIENSFTSNDNAPIYLSNRYNNIIYYLLQGYSYLEIANYLDISSSTTKRYIKFIYEMLNISSPHELVRLLHNGKLKVNPKVIEPPKSNIKNNHATEKEQTILAMLNKKKSLKEIANELSITQFSTKYYIRKLKQKKLVD